MAALILAAVVLTVLNLNRGDEAAPPASDQSSSVASSAAPSPTASGVAGDASVCGLDEEVLSGTVTTAPAATWQYQDVYAYPTSPTFGPGATAPQGYRYCYQHSPDGAVFAAANMTIGLFGDVTREPRFSSTPSRTAPIETVCCRRSVPRARPMSAPQLRAFACCCTTAAPRELTSLSAEPHRARP